LNFLQVFIIRLRQIASDPSSSWVYRGSRANLVHFMDILPVPPTRLLLV